VENVTLDELSRNVAAIHEEIKQMHSEFVIESRNFSALCHELDRRLTRTEERVLFFCAIAGAVSGLMSNFISRFF
jgi:hypothetical protein